MPECVHKVLRALDGETGAESFVALARTIRASEKKLLDARTKRFETALATVQNAKFLDVDLFIVISNRLFF